MHTLIELLVVAGMLLAIIALVQVVADRFSIPEATLLSLVGITLGVGYVTLDRTMPTIADYLFGPLVDPKLPAEAYLAVFLPPLLFQVALSVDVRKMLQDAAPILLLAVVAVFVTTGAIGYSLSLVVEHGLLASLLLGAVVATTDPSAVVGIFRDVGAPGRLIHLVEGESLLNDAAAIALVGVVITMMTGGHASLSEGLRTLGFSFGGGVLLGMIAGRLLVALLPRLHGLASAETSLSMALPWPLYLFADEILGVSGVVAVVCAGLVINGMGRTRLSARNWNHMQLVWEQTAVLAGAAVFLLAAVRVPHLLAGMRWHDAGYLAIALGAALVARLAVLFLMLPALSTLRLSEPISNAYKLAIAWGGLRGAVTLVLALGIAENTALPQHTRHFIANMATGFVLFSLLVNGGTLRWVIRALKLDRLSPQDQALQQQAIALSTAEVEATVRRVATVFRMPQDIAADVNRQFHRDMRIGTAPLDPETALSERDRLAIGLTTLAQRERDLIPDYGNGIVSVRNLDAMMRNTGHMIDAARSEGRIGYNRVARDILAYTHAYRFGLWAHRFLHWNWPLEAAMADRYELMICRRAVLERLRQYNRDRLGQLLGARMSEVLDGVLVGRVESVDASIQEMRQAHPSFAAALERRLLLLFALNQGKRGMEVMVTERVISREVSSWIERELDQVWKSTIPRPKLSRSDFFSPVATPPPGTPMAASAPIAPLPSTAEIIADEQPAGTLDIPAAAGEGALAPSPTPVLAHGARAEAAINAAHQVPTRIAPTEADADATSNAPSPAAPMTEAARPETTGPALALQDGFPDPAPAPVASDTPPGTTR